MNYDDATLIAQYIKISNFVAQDELALKAKHEKPRAAMEGIKAELMKRLIERKANNTTTPAGTAFLSDHLNVKVESVKSLLGFIAEHWDNGGGELCVIKPPVEAVRDYMAMHEGKYPPGCSATTFTRINIRQGK